MAGSEFESIIELGWEILPLAKHVLSPKSGESQAVETRENLIGKMRSLAAGLHQRQQLSFARLIQRIAASFAELFEYPGCRVDDETVANLSIALEQIGERLVELEATDCDTLPEPTQLLSSLDADLTRLKMMPHETTRRAEVGIRVRREISRELNRNCDTLCDASQSLLDRVQGDQESPYAPPVSKIHFLATRMRDQISELVQEVASERVDSRAEAASTSQTDAVTEIADETAYGQDLNPTAESPHYEIAIRSVSEETESSAVRLRKVLIVEKSPFFRLLFQTAIEAAGYPTQVASDLDDVERQSVLCGAVVWGEDRSENAVCRLRTWLSSQHEVARPVLIATVDEQLTGSEVSPEYDSLVYRGDVVELINILNAALGGSHKPVLRIA